MVDGVNTSVTVAPSTGPRLRGTAQGLGHGTDIAVELSRPELFDARRTGDIGLVHSWELVTAVDGPGTRMTLFLSGCPLRCQYCHNPDTMTMKEGTIEKVEDIIAKILRYKRVFQASGGGLTISGGEPLFQIAFTRKILSAVHDAGIHTAIDTSGFLGANMTDADLESVDLVLLDVKSGIPETYKEVTGQELQPTIDFGDRLHALGKKVWVRFVLVPGLTDAEENIQAVCDIVSRWKDNVERIEVLPFHNMGQDKWQQLGLHYNLENVAPPTAESVAHTRAVFANAGFTVY
ncbi:MAG: pyruvate formate-lyase-activating protein [Corynebacterium sp.]|uniref:pyruvate formate-lyase-activating protein n=1 Tax=Corynebacterium sp. TaxID=1720 RepID=UPI0026DAB4A3|nr:pyruvate formate-lyase-activating protein [Corynebacterium sp.]MDO5098510.1 pyruvate formate-lyase-activating protein [Corynebacterium sp.]